MSKPTIETGSAEAFRLLQKQRAEKRHAERLKRAETVDMIHVDFSVRVFNRILNDMPHTPNNPVEKTAVNLWLEQQGLSPLYTDAETMKAMEEWKAKQHVRIEAERQKTREQREAEKARRQDPVYLILNFWRNHQLEKIEAMKLDELERGHKDIRVLWQKRGLAMPYDEFHSLNVLLHNAITKKRTQPRTTTAEPKKRRKLGFL